VEKSIQLKVTYEAAKFFQLPVLSGSGVPPTAKAGYIESEGYPEGYPNSHEQVMSSLHQTEHIKHFPALL